MPDPRTRRNDITIMHALKFRNYPKLFRLSADGFVEVRLANGCGLFYQHRSVIAQELDQEINRNAHPRSQHPETGLRHPGTRPDEIFNRIEQENEQKDSGKAIFFLPDDLFPVEKLIGNFPAAELREKRWGHSGPFGILLSELPAQELFFGKHDPFATAARSHSLFSSLALPYLSLTT